VWMRWGAVVKRTGAVNSWPSPNVRGVGSDEVEGALHTAAGLWAFGSWSSSNVLQTTLAAWHDDAQNGPFLSSSGSAG